MSLAVAAERLDVRSGHVALDRVSAFPGLDVPLGPDAASGRTRGASEPLRLDVGDFAFE